MSLGTTYSLTVQGEGLQVTKFDQCLGIVMVIGKCTDVFSGDFLVWRGVTFEDLSMEELVMGLDNFHEGSAGYSSTF